MTDPDIILGELAEVDFKLNEKTMFGVDEITPEIQAMIDNREKIRNRIIDELVKISDQLKIEYSKQPEDINIIRQLWAVQDKLQTHIF